MLKFLCFGSGSSGNCYYLSNGQEAIIIDAGVGIRAIKKNFLKYGINPAKIKAILVTHDHMDHVRAVNPLSKLLNVKVFSSEKVIWKLIRSRLTQIDPSASQPVEAGVTFMIGNLAITPFQLPHDAADNYGYAVCDEGSVFTIMTDIGQPTNVVNEFIAKSNFLVLEADYDDDKLEANPRYDRKLKERIRSGNGHLSNEQTAQLLVDNYHNGLKYIWLCHLSEENNSPELAKTTIADTLAKHGITEKELNLEVLHRKIVSGPWLISSKGINADQQLTVDFDF